jgi:hypothetical protein
MAKNIDGVLVAGTIKTQYDSDRFPTVLSKDMKGGHHSVTSSSDRDAIYIALREFGMTCFVLNDNKTYQLLPVSSSDLSNNLNWTLYNSSSNSSSTEWFNSVYSITGTPPGPATDGSRYIVGTPSYSDFVGHYNQIATYKNYLNNNAGGWTYAEPSNGSSVRVDDIPNAILVFNGTSSTSGTWNFEYQNTVRYISPMSSNRISFSYSSPLYFSQNKILTYSYSIFLATFGTSNSGTCSLSIDSLPYKEIKKLSGNSLISLDPNDFVPNVQYELTYVNDVFQIQLPSLASSTIGPAEDGSYADGLYTDFIPSTLIGTPIDRFNQVLKSLAPPPSPTISSWAILDQSQFVAAKLSYSASNTSFVSTTYSNIGTVDKGQIFDKSTANGYRLGVRSGYAAFSSYYKDISGIVNNLVLPYNSSPVYAYPTYSFGNAMYGTFSLYLNGVTVSTLNLSSTSSAIDTTSGGATSGLSLSPTTNSRFPNGDFFTPYYGRTASFLIKKDNPFIYSGFNFLEIKHTSPSFTYSLTRYEFISDISSSTPSFGSIQTLNFNKISKYLSGISYVYQANYTQNVVVNNIYQNVYCPYSDAGIFSDSSIQEFTTICNGTSYISSSLPDLFTYSGPVSLGTPSSVSDLFTFSNVLSTKLQRRRFGSPSSMGVSVKTPLHGTFFGGESSLNWILDTFPSSSTPLVENFDDENFRYQNLTFNSVSDLISGTWSSQNSLLTQYTNGLQVCDGKLIYPYFNFSGVGSSNTNFNYELAATRNYTNCKYFPDQYSTDKLYPWTVAGSRAYTRLFNLGLNTSYSKLSLYVSFTNCIFKQVGTSSSTLNNNTDCYLEVKLPYLRGTPPVTILSGSVSGWLDACNPLDELALPENNQGCLEGSVPTMSGQEWKINFGLLNTYYSGGNVLVRIHAGPYWNGYIDNIQIVPN